MAKTLSPRHARRAPRWHIDGLWRHVRKPFFALDGKTAMPAPKRAPKGTKKPETDAVKYNTLDLDYLRRQFDEFDKDKSGFLEEDECKAALAKIGSNLKFADLDTDKDHKISFEEFTVRASTSCTITR